MKDRLLSVGIFPSEGWPERYGDGRDGLGKELGMLISTYLQRG